jgi:hypothetical protein
VKYNGKCSFNAMLKRGTVLFSCQASRQPASPVRAANDMNDMDEALLPTDGEISSSPAKNDRRCLIM